MRDDIRDLKAELRRAALARRDAMTTEARIEASLAIADHVAALVDITPGMPVSGFLPIRSEIDIRPLMMTLADRGALLCVPAIVEGRLVFRQLVRGAPLEPQGFGTYAPGADAAIFDPELMLVPLAAFDRRGGRVGYGRGYYDGAIASLREKGMNPRLVGIAFAVQEVEHVPMESHDIFLDVVVTEAGVAAGAATPSVGAAN
ncbi:5-formyltetrahydrofolate cyclo-ligase [Aurantimonas endophytica]|uniref:5-formyltetrahydrofolate cyclo-ligase n=1 Tax=Aurantimonas endophytica TaxID=1522175 RepID=A0A7W6HFJ8_9HYPH|nr:5-formyltetrahydrofolate cyclo-ligase [Aurantimonas endophytica]MBB4004003.1 5-formyltetrahydrofolate cyclo-ligase [Aurantimonas endophytica]MCO6404852.1 5-formyltetrahydrofolate cyclo-ligase [Aurantimonas endophytica]